MEQSKEVQLAYHIARALDDLESIDWHIGVCKRKDEKSLKAILADTLSRTYLDNPAAYYNKRVTSNGKYSRN
jgi:hypothetical protein